MVKTLEERSGFLGLAAGVSGYIIGRDGGVADRLPAVQFLSQLVVLTLGLRIHVTVANVLVIS
ncbi:hypothetical protein [Arthrobacter ruber]|uniref:hypothetical protein n=1 Tax=Arthrobacter ruber TaxID=1258893 RepID=UPI0012FFD9AF|nr:hypothetical protein [Arthrobacter ruber]